MGFCDDIRARCRAIVATARWVRIDDDALARIAPGDPPQLDPGTHFLDGAPEAVATFVLALDAVNFGSGWFAELGDGFGYETVASGLAERFRAAPVRPEELRDIERADVAAIAALPGDHALTAHFTAALRELGRFVLQEGGAPALIAAADGSAELFAARLSAELPMWRDPLAKRAQLVASDLVLAGVAEFGDLDVLTLFADNLVPHVLRREGALVLDPELAAHLDGGRLLPEGEQELELRAASIVAGERLARRLGVSERDLDGMLWQRGQAASYADPPPHRSHTTHY